MGGVTTARRSSARTVRQRMGGLAALEVEAMDDATRRMIDAIDVINAATFSAGEKPTGDADKTLGEVYRWTLSEGDDVLKLRNYQRRGISSRVVADALRAGVLTVRIEDS